MPGINLSRAEAEERAAILMVHSYEVNLDLSVSDEIFRARTTARFRCHKVGASTFIDVVAKSLNFATLNDVPINLSKFDGESLFLDNLSAENILIIDANANFTNTGEGLHRFVDPVDSEVYLYSQFETADARRMYACFDQPDLKATFALTVIAPSHWECISNNPIESRVDLGEAKNTWTFTPTPRIPTYITALVAGPYTQAHDTYVGSDGQVPLGIYCRKSLEPFLDASEIFDITKRGFNYFEQEFGLSYPFAKYDQIAVAEFNAGAMENAGCVTFAEDYFVFRSKVTEDEHNWRANTILHEMAHMWFGDLVTMKWWDDLWLNESFAEWASYAALQNATRFKNSWTVFNAQRKNWAYRQDQLSSTHPIGTDMVDLETVKANFDGITYAKGASALRQLVIYVGEKNFVNALKKYFVKHAWQNTTLNDLIVELEAASGRDLGPWVATWLQTAGVNTLKPAISIQNNKYASVKIHQSAPTIPANSEELRPHRLAVGLYDVVEGSLVARSSHELDVSGAVTKVKELNGLAKADLLLLNDRDYSYAKIRFDKDSLKSLTQYIDRMPDSLAQSLSWAAAWDMTRDGELSASEFVSLGLQAVRGESKLANVARTIAQQLDTAVELYAAPSNRDRLRTQLASGYFELLTAASAGSDHQLSFARAFATAATNSPEKIHHEQLTSLLAGSLPGLTLDNDMRWHLISSLATLGRHSEAEINAELAKDNTASGQKSATFALAARPDNEVKRMVWERILTGTEANHTNDALIMGFRRSSQRKLIAPYANKYFETVEELWNRTTFEIAATFANLMFPMYETTESTLTSADEWLLGHLAAPTALRRYVAENRDGISRALAAQRCDQRSH